MSHWPGQAPTSWKRLFYAALAHGAKIIDLYEMHSTFLVRTILLLGLVGPLAPQELLLPSLLMSGTVSKLHCV